MDRLAANPLDNTIIVCANDVVGQCQSICPWVYNLLEHKLWKPL